LQTACVDVGDDVVADEVVTDDVVNGGTAIVVVDVVVAVEADKAANATPCAPVVVGVAEDI